MRAPRVLTAVISDEFLVIKDPSLLPTDHEEPSSYDAVDPKMLDRPSTIDDICTFFVEYMQSDLAVSLLRGLLCRASLKW